MDLDLAVKVLPAPIVVLLLALGLLLRVVIWGRPNILNLQQQED